jgi:hypothetical protein
MPVPVSDRFDHTGGDPNAAALVGIATVDASKVGWRSTIR